MILKGLVPTIPILSRRPCRIEIRKVPERNVRMEVLARPEAKRRSIGSGQNSTGLQKSSELGRIQGLKENQEGVVRTYRGQFSVGKLQIPLLGDQRASDRRAKNRVI